MHVHTGKQKMLDFNLIAAFVVFGTPGVLYGLASEVPPIDGS